MVVRVTEVGGFKIFQFSIEVEIQVKLQISIIKYPGYGQALGKGAQVKSAQQKPQPRERRSYSRFQLTVSWTAEVLQYVGTFAAKVLQECCSFLKHLT